MRAWLLVLVLIFAVSGCRGANSTPSPAPTATVAPPQRVPVDGDGSYLDVSAVGLVAMLRNKDFLLINVHIPYAGELEGTDLFIPYDQIEANLDRLPTDRGAKLVLYCRTGGMAAIAARTLVKLGYSNVWNLDGGMVAWEEAGYQLVVKSR